MWRIVTMTGPLASDIASMRNNRASIARPTATHSLLDIYVTVAAMKYASTIVLMLDNDHITGSTSAENMCCDVVALAVYACVVMEVSAALINAFACAASVSRRNARASLLAWHHVAGEKEAMASQA